MEKEKAEVKRKTVSEHVCPVCGKKHECDCDHCPHQEHVQAGEYADHAFEKTPCFGCMDCENIIKQVKQDTGHYSSYESLEASRAITGIAEDIAALIDQKFNGRMSVMQAMKHFAETLLTFPTFSLVAMLRRIRGDSLDNIALEMSAAFRRKITKANVCWFLSEVTRENSIAKIMLPKLAAKQHAKEKRNE